MDTKPEEGRRHDPRGLSRTKPGRSEIQDEAPNLPPAQIDSEKPGRPGRMRAEQGRDHETTVEERERRAARAVSAEPAGKKGSRKPPLKS
jgi:hypothetical protein